MQRASLECVELFREVGLYLDVRGRDGIWREGVVRKVVGRLMWIKVINFGFEVIHLERESDRLGELHQRSGSIEVPEDKKRQMRKEEVQNLVQQIILEHEQSSSIESDKQKVIEFFFGGKCRKSVANKKRKRSSIDVITLEPDIDSNNATTEDSPNILVAPSSTEGTSTSTESGTAKQQQTEEQDMKVEEEGVGEEDDEDDVHMVFQEVSLLDPLSAHRISTPVRGIMCTHIACFDLATHIDFNLEQGANAVCPICRKQCGIRILLVDAYIKSLLDEDKIKCGNNTDLLHSGVIRIQSNGTCSIFREPKMDESNSCGSLSESESDYDCEEEMIPIHNLSPSLQLYASLLQVYLERCMKVITEMNGSQIEAKLNVAGRAVCIRNRALATYQLIYSLLHFRLHRMPESILDEVMKSVDKGVQVIEAWSGGNEKILSFANHPKVDIQQDKSLEYDIYRQMKEYARRNGLSGYEWDLFGVSPPRHQVSTSPRPNTQSSTSSHSHAQEFRKVLTNPGHGHRFVSTHPGSNHSSHNSSNNAHHHHHNNTKKQKIDKQKPFVVNLNTASVAEIARVPGFSLAIARRIVNRRQMSQPLSCLNDLRLINGIGKKKLEMSKPYITF